VEGSTNARYGLVSAGSPHSTPPPHSSPASWSSRKKIDLLDSLWGCRDRTTQVSCRVRVIHWLISPAFAASTQPPNPGQYVLIRRPKSHKLPSVQEKGPVSHPRPQLAGTERIDVCKLRRNPSTDTILCPRREVVNPFELQVGRLDLISIIPHLVLLTMLIGTEPLVTTG
jgi:hypothetical protein